MGARGGPHRGGRPSILPRKKAAILKAKRKGKTDTQACRDARIPLSTLDLWKRNGRNRETGIYRDFLNEYELAADVGQAVNEDDYDDWTNKSKDPMRWKAHRLAILYPSWRKNRTVEHSGEVAVQHSGTLRLETMTDADLEKALAKARADLEAEAEAEAKAK